jgi:hypothetical protein
MSAERAIEILDSAHELIGHMARGQALGLQLKEISRCMCLVVNELPRPDNVAGVVNKVRSAAAWYAVRYERNLGCDTARSGNQARFDTLVSAYLELRAHLQLQIGVRLPDGTAPRRGRF